jgi:NAD(P)H-dependent FMN reductase
MKIIISGTNRPGSRSFEIAKIAQRLYGQLGETYEILDLSQLPLNELNGTHYGATPPPAIADWIAKLNHAEAVVVVVPEYNGSMPGILKYFIDFWKYPDTFEYRPIAMIGLGGNFGGLRPVEHLQQVFNYRNAFVFPERVFITNVWNNLKDGKILDANVTTLLERQARNFTRFVKALHAEQLDANSVSAAKKP